MDQACILATETLADNSCHYLLLYRFAASRGPSDFSGEHTRMATPVPIPNTAVKHPGPMVVSSDARVGYRREFVKGLVAKVTRPFRLRRYWDGQCSSTPMPSRTSTGRTCFSKLRKWASIPRKRRR